MKTEPNDGGPAFPASNQTDSLGRTLTGSFGMSLRDYFAAAALTGLIDSHLRTVQDDVKLAYEYANYMLMERDKKK